MVEEVELSLVVEEEQQLKQVNLVSLELLDKETEVQVELMLVVSQSRSGWRWWNDS